MSPPPARGGELNAATRDGELDDRASVAQWKAELWRAAPRRPNGPALAGYGAQAMRDALAAQMTMVPAQLRRSLA